MHINGTITWYYPTCTTWYNRTEYFPVFQVPSQKYLRNNSGFNHKAWMEDSMSRTDNFPFQVREVMSKL